jgi:hypothetical protein
MKKLVGYDVGTYAFAPGLAGAGTVTLTLPYILAPEQVLLVTDVTRGINLYSFADSTHSGTIANNVITLAIDTSAYSSSDALSIYIDVPTEETQYELEPITEQFTYDTNMAQVLGSLALNDGQGNLKTKGLFTTDRSSGILGVAQQEFSADCSNYQTGAIQLSGTWSGTVSFEAQADGGNWVSINGMAINGTSIITSTTTTGIYRFNVAGLKRLRVRCTAYSSGTVFVTIALGSGESIVNISSPVSGSQAQPLSQRATSFELNTFDTNLSAVLGNAALWRTGFTAVDSIVVPTVSPAQPTTYAANMFAKYPQLFPRLRVEAGGDQKLPLAQEVNTNRLLVAYPEIYSLLEQILITLNILNQNYASINNVSNPISEIR